MKKKKKINRVIILRINEILNLVFIDAYELFSKSFIKNITFLKIIDNSLRKIWITYIKNKKFISTKLNI